jgi:hypothetical protein
MPFNREYILTDEGYQPTINRERTGPPVRPETGTAVGTEGAVIADSVDVFIAPSKIIPVTMPGPREPVLDASGIMAPRWRRFFEELYRRTGALEDNVNGLANRELGGAGIAIDAVVISGSAPTIIHDRVAVPSTGSAGITPNLVKLHGVMEPSTATLDIAEQQADRTVA